VTRHTDTVDIAGIAFRLSCPFPKPGFWARRRPEFITPNRPDVIVRIDYDERFARRGVVADTVADAAAVSRRGQGLLVSTGYYRATVDVPRGRAAVRIAAGFDVASLMRTLAALWLAECGTVLLRAACFGAGESATLACGLPDWTTPPSATRGWLAVAPRRGRVEVRPTPFLDHAGDPRERWRAADLWMPGPVDEPSIGGAWALRALLPSIWQSDRRRPAVERTLDLATRVATSLRCRAIAAANLQDEAAVG